MTSTMRNSVARSLELGGTTVKPSEGRPAGKQAWKPGQPEGKAVCRGDTCTSSSLRRYVQGHYGEQQVDPGSLMPSPDRWTPNSDGFVVQNPWGCEQRCRWDIHETVPDILVTNFSMLQVMAARAIDDRFSSRLVITWSQRGHFSTWSWTSFTCTETCQRKWPSTRTILGRMGAPPWQRQR